MSKISMQKPNGNARVLRYSRENLPPDEESARIALEEACEEIISVEVSLDHAETEAFATEKEYQAWRTRAQNALRYARCEREFLERWLKNPEDFPQVESQEVPRRGAYTHHGLRALGVEFKERVRGEVERLSAQIGVAYTKGNAPESITQARQRRLDLTELRIAVSAVLADLERDWLITPLGERGLRIVKRPLTAILQGIDAELAFLKNYILAHPDPETVLHWRTVLSDGLRRAESQGLQLNADEKSVLALVSYSPATLS